MTTVKQAPASTFTSLWSSHSCSRHQTRNVPLVPVNLKTFIPSLVKGLQAAIEDGLNVHPSECHQPVMSLPSDPGGSSSDVPRCNGVVTQLWNRGSPLHRDVYRGILLAEWLSSQHHSKWRVIHTLRHLGAKQKSSGSLCCILLASFVWEQNDDLTNRVTIAMEKNTNNTSGCFLPKGLNLFFFSSNYHLLFTFAVTVVLVCTSNTIGKNTTQKVLTTLFFS